MWLLSQACQGGWGYSVTCLMQEFPSTPSVCYQHCLQCWCVSYANSPYRTSVSHCPCIFERDLASALPYTRRKWSSVLNWERCKELVCWSVWKWVFLKADAPILTSVFFTINWLTLTPKTQFVQFCLKVASYFLFRCKNKYVTLEMRLSWKYIRKSKLVYRK